MHDALNWFRRLIGKHPFYVAFGATLILAIIVGVIIAVLILTGGIAAFPLLAIAAGAVASSIGAGAIVGTTVATAVAVGAVCSLGILAFGALLVGVAALIIGPKRVFGGKYGVLEVPLVEVEQGEKAPISASSSLVPAVKLHEIMFVSEVVVPNFQPITPEDVVVFVKEVETHLMPNGGGENDIATVRAQITSEAYTHATTRMLNTIEPRSASFKKIAESLFSTVDLA
jgi:hypothetical protein